MNDNRNTEPPNTATRHCQVQPPLPEIVPPLPPAIPPEIRNPVTPEEVRIVTRFLFRRGWVTAEQLAAEGLSAALGLTSERAFRRKLRAISQSSDGAILSP